MMKGLSFTILSSVDVVITTYGVVQAEAPSSAFKSSTLFSVKCTWGNAKRHEWLNRPAIKLPGCNVPDEVHQLSSIDPHLIDCSNSSTSGDRVILDEAHTIRNITTETAKACYQLQAVKRWAVTGTPIQARTRSNGTIPSCHWII
jgi:SNF2 family DNA or RNA helicase